MMFPGLKAMMEWVSFTSVPEGMSHSKLFSHEVEIVPLPFKVARDSMDLAIKNIVGYLDCTDYRFFITGVNNYRDEVATIKQYKGNRKENRKPHWYNQLKDYVLEYHKAEVVDGREADDALGYNQTEDTVICTIDKDLKMIKGQNFDFVNNKLIYVSEQEGNIFFLKQLLTGDSTDNIQGCPMIGKVKADTMIDDKMTIQEGLDVVYEQYLNYFDDAELALDSMRENGNLLWIQREEGIRWTNDKHFKSWTR